MKYAPSSSSFSIANPVPENISANSEPLTARSVSRPVLKTAPPTFNLIVLEKWHRATFACNATLAAPYPRSRSDAATNPNCDVPFGQNDTSSCVETYSRSLKVGFVTCGTTASHQHNRVSMEAALGQALSQ